MQRKAFRRWRTIRKNVWSADSWADRNTRDADADDVTVHKKQLGGHESFRISVLIGIMIKYDFMYYDGICTSAAAFLFLRLATTL